MSLKRYIIGKSLDYKAEYQYRQSVKRLLVCSCKECVLEITLSKTR